MENPVIILLMSLGLAIAVTPGVYGQTKGTVDYKYLGIRFVIPDGWVGQETQGGFLIGSHTEPGIGLVTIHQYKTVEQLGQQAQQGIYDQNGTALTVAGQLEAVGNSGIGGEFQGTLEGQPVKAYILALVNPHGNGVTIMAATSPHLYAPTHKNLALQLANNLEFYKAEIPPVVDEWREALKNSRLTYMDSYYSGGGVSINGYSTGGGYSSKEEIHLCSQGFFKYNSSSNVSIDTGGAFGSSGGRGQGAGNWEVVGNSQGGATLRLNFHNGEVYEYVLEYRDKRTLLNGRQYFRTYGNEGTEYAPDCN